MFKDDLAQVDYVDVASNQVNNNSNLRDMLNEGTGGKIEKGVGEKVENLNKNRMKCI